MKYKVLYNPLAGAINDTAFYDELKDALEGDEIEYYDIPRPTTPSFLRA